MSPRKRQQDRNVMPPAVTRCQLLWAALFLIVSSIVGWALILHFLA